MSFNDFFFEYCGQSKFWDWNISWNTNDPRLSRCFHQTLLSWIPSILFYILFIFEFIKVIRLKNRETSWNFFNVTRVLFSFFAVSIHLSYFCYLITLKHLQSYSKVPTQADICSPLFKTFSFLLVILIFFLHKQKGIIISSIIWLFLIFETTFSVLIYFQLWVDFKEYDQIEFYFHSFYLILLIGLLILTSFSDRSNLIQVILDKENLTHDNRLKSVRYPELLASFPSRLTFAWFDKIIYYGWKRSLTKSDLPEPKIKHKAEYLSSLYDQYFTLNESSSVKTKDVLGLTPLFKELGPSFLLGSFFKLLHDICVLTSPQLLRLLINFIEKGGQEPQWHGVLFALLLFLVSTLQTLFLAAYFHRAYTASLQWKSYVMSNTFKKSLSLSYLSRNQTTLGQIVNLLAVDSQKITDIFPFINMLWSAPFQLLAASYFLYKELGYSVLFGFGTIIILLPINVVCTKFSKKVQIKQMKHKDERVKEMNEILNGIKILKLFAWETSFINNVDSIRSLEISNLKKFFLIGLINILTFSITPLIFSITTFGVYVTIAKQSLTPQKAFVSLSLFNILRFPLAMIPLLISFMVMALVSFKRLYNFFKHDEVEKYVTRNEDSNAVVIKNGYFRWTKIEKNDDNNQYSNDTSVPEVNSVSKNNDFQLKEINLEIEKGSFVAIIGPFGSGKSSILFAMLGEMYKQSGDVNIHRDTKIAYVPQQAWIQNLTFKDNITFGKVYNELQFSQIVSACELDTYLKMLPAGLETEIGEKGINLSGGQKQRVSLARACYYDSDLYLLDDPLSAVDAHVSRKLFDNVLSSTSGILKNKTRVLVTNNLNILQKVDKIIVLKNGTIDEIGSYQYLLKNGKNFAELIKNFSLQDTEKEEKFQTSNELRAQSIKSSYDLKKSKLVKEEETETGSVKFKVYIEYFKMLSYPYLFIFICGFVFSSIFYMASSLWLADWSNKSAQGEVDVKTRLLFYIAFGTGQAIFVLIGGYSLVKGCERASKQSHKLLLNRILRSPMTFFDTTPAGRIVNRFSKDIDILDLSIPDSFRSWLSCLCNVFCSLFIIVLQTPLFFAFLIPISFIYYFIQKMYVASSRQLKRLESVTRSPIYSHFHETLAGVFTIRAFNENTRFVQEFFKKVNYNQVFNYSSVIANRWLSVRLEFIANFITLFAALFAVLSKYRLEAGNVGLSITYAISVSQILNWLIRMTSELETNIVAVERIIEYCSLDQESDWEEGESKPRSDWPSEGKIEFCNYSTRYREGLDLVLKNISALIKPKEKIGIIGRTGAGKSSITLALFRILEAVDGTILIDDCDISKLPLHYLRSKLTIIPQDPTLFSGTLRYNLDPFNNHTDEEIWMSLENVHLKDFVENLSQGIYHMINEGGSNVSVGQQQLICLARALLKRPKILILDEATAAMDLETDSLIQETIRKEFKDCTVLTIAHRLNTILDSDRVLVVENGRIIEFDSPQRLMENPYSVFTALARDANIIKR